MSMTINKPRVVSFEKETTIHYIQRLDSDLLKELFYSKDDYERFRFERQMEIERNRRGENGVGRRARRSSIDLVRTQNYQQVRQDQTLEHYLLMRKMEQDTCRNMLAEKRIARRTTRRASTGPGMALAA